MTAITADIDDVISRLHDRVPIDGHDGRSGATLERARFDGIGVVIKTVDPARDLTWRLAADAVGREQELWRRGVLDDLGPGVTHAVLAAGRHRGRLVTVMRDLGGAVLHWDRRLSRTDLDRIFAALTTVHRRYAGAPPAGLGDLGTRLTLLSPARMAPLADTHPLAAAVVEGWRVFFDIVPDPVATAVDRAHHQANGVATALQEATPTLCHGDAWLVNMALTADAVVLLDWNLATAGPGVIDLVSFAVGCASHIDASREEVLEAARLASGHSAEDRTWNAAVVWALCELGWNKALDAVTHEDAAQRAAARDELDWWVRHAGAALERIG